MQLIQLIGKTCSRFFPVKDSTPCLGVGSCFVLGACECGGCVYTCQESTVMGIAAVHFLSDGVRDCFISNSCLIVKVQLDNFHFCSSDWLLHNRRSRNSTQRFIKTSPVQLESSFNCAIKLCLFLHLQTHDGTSAHRYLGMFFMTSKKKKKKRKLQVGCGSCACCSCASCGLQLQPFGEPPYEDLVQCIFFPSKMSSTTWKRVVVEYQHSFLTFSSSYFSSFVKQDVDSAFPTRIFLIVWQQKRFLQFQRTEQCHLPHA